MAVGSERVQDWVRRLSHDLLKPLLCLARDLAATGTAPVEGDVATMRRVFETLVDAEGCAVDAMTLWGRFRDELEQIAPGVYRFDKKGMIWANSYRPA